MTKYYRDYVWKGGMPYGISVAGEELPPEGVVYKIASDPYHKRISIEKYVHGDFDRIVYDSVLFNFRHLRPNQHTAWEKRTISEAPQTMICHLFDQDDRLVVIEEYFFEKELCRECRACSPHGVWLSTQKMLYTVLGDSFNGVCLHDSEGKTVMSKRYAFDPEMQEFTTLLEENWNPD